MQMHLSLETPLSRGEITMCVDMKIEERKVNPVGQGWLSPLLGLYKVPVHSLIVSITFFESEKAAIKTRKLETERIINKPYIFTDARWPVVACTCIGRFPSAASFVGQLLLITVPYGRLRKACGKSRKT
jgi:hypothetical protein